MLILGSALGSKGAGLHRRRLRAINIVGGFLVTDRMLDMFKRRPRAGAERRE
jgi:NAD/NADP transhydrogenase alpha subunit